MVGYPLTGDPIEQSASNTLLMTGGTLTMQNGILMSVGRGRSINGATNQVHFNMTGGVVNAAGIVVPEVFDPSLLTSLGLTSTGINTFMDVSGNSIVNTDLLRIGAGDSNAHVTVRDNAQINLTDDNLGFATGVLWINAFEATPVGTAVLDIRDNAVVTIHGEWWTDENHNGIKDPVATSAELNYYRTHYIANNWITANGGATYVKSWLSNGVIYMSAVVPEPSSIALVAIAGPIALAIFRRRK